MRLSATGFLGILALAAAFWLLRAETATEPQPHLGDDGGAGQLPREVSSSAQLPTTRPSSPARNQAEARSPGNLSSPLVGGPPPPVPGTDLCLGGSWEPTIAVDPNDQDTIAVAQGSRIWISFDGGDNFNAADTIVVQAPPNIALGGDPSIGFDSRGALILTLLGSPSVGGRNVYIFGWSRVNNSFNQTIGPVNVTGAAGMPASNNADKEWLAVDWHQNSPNRDALHVTWTDIGTTPDWTTWSTSSSDNGTTWSPATLLSTPADGPRPWGVHNTVNSAGDVFVTHHTQTGFLDTNLLVPDGISGGVAVHRSVDGGISYMRTATDPFQPGEADATWNVQHVVNGVVPGNNSWWLGNSQSPILADPSSPKIIYVVAVDDPDNNIDFGDPADIFIARSEDFGASWGAPVRVDDCPPGTFSIMPSAAIDTISGAIVVTWYDNRTQAMGISGQFLLDLRARSSSSQGNNWFPSVDIDDSQLDPGLSLSCRFCCSVADCNGGPSTQRIGEYNGVAFGECTAHIVWAGNRACSANSTALNVFYDRDPELGGDLTSPVVTCPPNISIGCNDSTHPQFTGFGTATDDCDLNPDVFYMDIESPGSCPPGTVLKSIERIWSATDAAGNIDNCSQIITVVDFDAPQILNLPGPLEIETDQGFVLATDPVIQNWLAPIVAVDDCSAAELNIILPDFFLGACDVGLVHSITVAAGDECGNGTFEVLELTVVIKPGRGTPFCFGTQSACPCGNGGRPGHGCDTVSGTGGVCLNDVNFISDGLGGGTVDLMGVGFPQGSTPTVIAIRSTTATPGNPLGDGILCLGGQIKRLQTRSAVDGRVLFNLTHDAGAGSFHYQLWFRDLPPEFCNSQAAYNLSNGLTLDWL